MAKIMTMTKRRNEQGMALLLALFTLLLLSGIGLCMILASTTETRIDANYGGSLRSYYAARSGLEEVRDRINLPTTSQISLATLLPQDIAGNMNGFTGVLYVLNPTGSEVVDPTDSASPYYDDQLCHDYNSGVSVSNSKCTVQPSTANWSLTQPAAQSPAQQAPLGYKWVRINIKTNRMAAPYYVDQVGAAATLDSRICWDGEAEQLTPGTTNPSCEANGMQTVYMLSSLAATAQTGGPNGSHKLLRLEVVAPSIRPPGVITMGAQGASNPVTMSSTPLLGGSSIPATAIDGRVHKLDGTLALAADGTPAITVGCSSVAPLGADGATGTAQIEAALNIVRKNIVTSANNSCHADGTSQSNICTPGLWWVRGTDAIPRFATTSGGGGGGRSNDDEHHDGHDHHGDPLGVGDSSTCDPSTASCYTNLDLSAPELMATAATFGLHTPFVTPPADGTAPFTGADGNQADESIYQPASPKLVGNSINVVNNLVSTSSSQSNYYEVSSTSLAGSYGTSTSPALLKITDPVLSLQGGASLSGYGVLVVPSGLEISGTLNWNGVVVVNSPTGHVTINAGATGSINGALLVQPGAAIALQNNGVQNNPTSFKLTYSCEAIDLPFNSRPFRIISSSETSF
jgi:Tfp pilus assembly protein PilX